MLVVRTPTTIRTASRPAGYYCQAVVSTPTNPPWNKAIQPGADQPYLRVDRDGRQHRQNWLFAQSKAGGQRAMAICSLVGTAKLNGLDPEAYLRHVLGCIADHLVNLVAELLPRNIGKGHAHTAA